MRYYHGYYSGHVESSAFALEWMAPGGVEESKSWDNYDDDVVLCMMTLACSSLGYLLYFFRFVSDISAFLNKIAA